MPIEPGGLNPSPETIAMPAPDPDLFRLDRTLLLRRGERVEFHLPFVPLSIRFDRGVLRGSLEPGWFGRSVYVWRVPRRAKSGRRFARVVATDGLLRSVTYSFSFAVRARR
jgi:hypothetical protein